MFPIAPFFPLMKQAVELASFAEQQGEVPVGAVVYSPTYGVIGTGYNCPISTHTASAHAEIIAIQNAGKAIRNYRLTNCILICTLEPCLMCFGACIHARLQGIVYGTQDYKSGAVESALQGTKLPFLNHTPWVLSGILQKECSNILRDFFQKKRIQSNTN